MNLGICLKKSNFPLLAIVSNTVSRTGTVEAGFPWVLRFQASSLMLHAPLMKRVEQCISEVSFPLASHPVPFSRVRPKQRMLSKLDVET